MSSSKFKNVFPVTFGRILATVTLGMMALAAFEIGGRLNAIGVFFSLSTFWWPVVLAAVFFSISSLIFVWTTRFQDLGFRFSRYHQTHFPANKWLMLGLFTTLAVGFSLWVLTRGYVVLNGYRTRVFFYLLVSTLGMFCLKAAIPDGNWKNALAGSMLVIGAIFKALIYALQGISTSPFSLSWSEGSRYYYGSLFFSQKVYGLDIPPSPWHASRYLLLSLPFGFSELPIWFHRSWQVGLWIGLVGLTGYLLARRLKLKQAAHLIPFTAWAYMYLNLGPVYYHLVVCAILIFWGVDFKKPVKTFIVVLLASIWAGLSRINWLPVPFFLVITLYFLEQPWDLSNQGWRYLVKPLVWSSGLVVAFLAYAAYIPLSGNTANKFGSTFTSDLLWNRLWPNSTYWMGIFVGAVAISFPLWLVLYQGYRNFRPYQYPIKWLGYFGMLAALFLGGLVVSVKIGGGSNLHNVDAYILLVMTTASYLYWGRVALDRSPPGFQGTNQIPGWITALIILVPVLLILREGGVVAFPDLRVDQADLQALQEIVGDVAEAGGEVLFIAERQLQVFGLAPEVTLIPDYEKVELMEMVMSGNQDYLDRFNTDISSQRFDLIIADSVRVDMKAEIDAFSKEHNVWVEKVTIPLLEYYQYSPLGGRKSIYIMTPK
jgi:hypothetical protein